MQQMVAQMVRRFCRSGDLRPMTEIAQRARCISNRKLLINNNNALYTYYRRSSFCGRDRQLAQEPRDAIMPVYLSRRAQPVGAQRLRALALLVSAETHRGKASLSPGDWGHFLEYINQTAK